jgi:signal transduction histidine kinase
MSAKAHTLNRSFASIFHNHVESLSAVLVTGGKAKKPHQVLIFLAIVSPVIAIAVFGCISTYRDLTASTFARRQSMAHLAATGFEQRFGRLTDIGVSLATRVRFRQLVTEGKWEQAIQILKDVPVNFSFVERAFLADPSGTLMADTPALPGVRGQTFAARDWYQGVSATGKPYISNVYQRAAEPRLNVIAAAIPIKAANAQKIVGILVLQVQLDALFVWSDAIGITPSESIYLFDKKGQLAMHPMSTSRGHIVDYSNMAVVRKALQGMSGVETMFNPLENDERIAAYAPVPGIHWGVVAAEPTQIAFQQRNSTITRLLMLYGCILLIAGIFAYMILRTVGNLGRAEQEILVLNRDLQQRAAELEATNKELESFSYSVSHDLRAPLRSIDGFSLALLEDNSDRLDGAGKDYLRRIRAASERMAQLIDDLLNLSRVARRAITRETVDLSAMADSIVGELQRTEPERRVAFSANKSLIVDGDERLLRVALENLLGNAWKFTGKCVQPKIEFGVKQDNGTPAYFVRDNGAGFDIAYADKLFGPFQRLHAVTEFKGTGIGLATVQRIVHRHGGRVWAESEVGKGATFYFTLN